MMSIDDTLKSLDDLNELSNMWLLAKEREGTATSDRRKIEDRIKSLAGIAENLEGTETVAPSHFTIKIQGRIDRKVDAAALSKGWDSLSADAQAAFDWKPSVKVSALRKLEGADAAAAAVFITAKPASPSITIEAV